MPAQGHRFVLCVTLGTGIGGALVLDGKVFRGFNGMAGEYGHMQMVPNGHRCECGNRGCWEQYASGNALVREAREPITNGSPLAHHLHDLVDGDPALLAGPQITRAARDGDPLSLELVGDIGEWLGVGLAGLAAALDPSCIVIGGGLSDARELLLEPARAVFTKSLTGRGHRAEPEIVIASLGADAGSSARRRWPGQLPDGLAGATAPQSTVRGALSLFGYQSRKALPADTP